VKVVQVTQANGFAALTGANILIVEDDVILLMELESILLDAGAAMVGACRTVNEALAAADQNDMEAAVLDVRLGHETIAPVARQLRKQGTPFLFYTGQVNNDPALAEWPDCRILSKPARANAIVAAVADMLRGNRDQRSAQRIVKL
jgi:DNA-binding response OmpR family regulator